MERLVSCCLFLDVSSPQNSEKTRYFEGRITDAAYKAEDIIESQVSNQIFPESGIRKYRVLQKVKEELTSVARNLVMMKEKKKEIPFLQPSNSLPAALSKSGSANKNAVVGFDEKLPFLTVDLTQGSSELEVISIAGIPGLGKTTLARQIYNSSLIASHFDLRAWVTVSQEFREQEVLERLLNSIRDVNYESRHESIEKLAENIYKSLKDKRYLLVIDDVWDIVAVNKVKSWIPRDDNGSRILLTTRNVRLAELTNPKRGHHRIPFLSDEESWDLLREMVFGKGRFPPKLNEIGKRIAHKCCGLPLVVVVIGGLLYKAERTLAYWEYVARKLGSLYDIQDILSFSYNQLPHHLRACFLYMGVFPEDHEIRRSKLAKLWVANRFIKPAASMMP